MALEDVGANPRRLAEAIHEQLGERGGPVPIREIAAALDIVEIREHELTSIEAALVTTPERGYGEILINLKSSPQRRRFSVGHELCHFLNPFHEPTAPTGLLPVQGGPGGADAVSARWFFHNALARFRSRD